MDKTRKNKIKYQCNSWIENISSSPIMTKIASFFCCFEYNDERIQDSNEILDPGKLYELVGKKK
jgi:hypothetical protein